MPKRKVTKEKGSTNTTSLPAAGRFAAARSRVGRAVRARPRADRCKLVAKEFTFYWSLLTES